MIIFDLSSIADDSHRRHFIEPDNLGSKEDFDKWIKPYLDSKTCPEWSPNWEAYNAACNGDRPIEPVISIWNKEISLGMMDYHQIWSGRCESVRVKTEAWLKEPLLCFESSQLKMRPIGNPWPQEALFESWYDMHGVNYPRDNIEMVFSSHKPTIEMLRRRGVFVFDCGQGE